MTELTFRRVDYTVKETAAAIRKALRTTFPGVKFSVTMSRGTGHGWLHVNWTDGPLEADVRVVTDGFRSEYFDGQDDSYHQISPTMYASESGEIVEHHWSCCGVNHSRTMSPEAEKWCEAIAVRGSYWWPIGLDPWEDCVYYAVRKLFAGTDLTHGFPRDPRAAYRESWAQ